MCNKQTDFLIGLDLGQSQDYTALTVFERFFKEQPAKYHMRHLERFKLGTPYPDQVAKTQGIVGQMPKESSITLIIDGTGAGRPVVDMFRTAQLNVSLVAISITGGDSVTEDGKDFKVPKRDLVSALQVLLQTGRLKVADGLSGADTLIQELLNFKVKISTGGHDSYEAWREGVHDDLVLSAAMACWYGEYKPYWSVSEIHSVPSPNKLDLSGFMPHGGLRDLSNFF